MFYQNDDVKPAVLMCESLLGPNGRIVENGIKNLAVATDAFGKIWYGDMDGPNLDVDTLQKIANVLSVQVHLLDSTGYGRPIHTFYPSTAA